MTTQQPVRADGSGQMFNQIAKRYDLLNRLMSFGLDRGWRRRLIESMPNHGRILDVATGTADVALAIARCHQNVTRFASCCVLLLVAVSSLLANGLEVAPVLDSPDS